MSSVVEICNRALGQIRAGSINNLNEASVQAQQCKLYYAISRDQVLKEADWGFNRALVPLQQLTDVDVFDWAYFWQYPNDCLHINYLIRNLRDIPQGTGSVVANRLYDHRFRRPQDLPKVEHKVYNVDGNRVIATTEPEIRINYRKRVEDPGLFGPNFEMALSFLLGSYLAIPIVGVKDGRQLRVDLLGMYSAFIATARDDNANEEYIDPQESEYITVRE